MDIKIFSAKSVYNYEAFMRIHSYFLSYHKVSFIVIPLLGDNLLILEFSKIENGGVSYTLAGSGWLEGGRAPLFHTLEQGRKPN